MLINDVNNRDFLSRINSLRVEKENVALDIIVNCHVIITVQILQLPMLTGVEANAELAIRVRCQANHCITAPACADSAEFVGAL